MADVGWRWLAARVRFRSDVIVFCASPRAPGFRIGVRNDGRGEVRSALPVLRYWYAGVAPPAIQGEPHEQEVSAGGAC